LQRAFAAGVVVRGSSWLGLPSPQELSNPAVFVSETRETTLEREQRQIEVLACISARGIGKATFDAAGGWKVSTTNPISEKQFRKACAEWADGELVASHVAYESDILCTYDRAGATGHSVFNSTNRAWLTERYRLTFMTVDQLKDKIERLA
jgi:hypothetical protein